LLRSIANEVNSTASCFVQYKNFHTDTEINREVKRENVKQVSERNTILRLIKFVLCLLFIFAPFLCCYFLFSKSISVYPGAR
jgi:heme/copper-type cytochrome/quinol oxidase subunit 3